MFDVSMFICFALPGNLLFLFSFCKVLVWNVFGLPQVISLFGRQKTAETFWKPRHQIPTQIVVVCCVVPLHSLLLTTRICFFFVFRGSQDKLIHLPLLTREEIQITPMKNGGLQHCTISIHNNCEGGQPNLYVTFSNLFSDFCFFFLPSLF